MKIKRANAQLIRKDYGSPKVLNTQAHTGNVNITGAKWENLRFVFSKAVTVNM